MSSRRKFADAVRTAVTWLSTSISVFVLAAIFVFVFSRGWKTLNWEILTSDYHPKNIMANVVDGEPGQFARPDDLPADAVFSERYGFALTDAVDHQKEKQMVLTYIADDSPLTAAVNAASGPTRGDPITITEDVQIQRIDYMSIERGRKSPAGFMGSQQTAAETIERLEADGESLIGFYYQSAGGGMMGSLLATLMLIGLTLAIALPLGVSAAVYLHELAPKNRVTAILRSLIEMLSGVPSIVFGLMGMTLLFSVTALFGITTQSILLGAMTLAVILFPVIIRQTEEALLVVPDGLRMASLSLGSSRTQMIFRVILPNAVPGILTATLLSISRVIGESAALIYTMGVAINDKPEIGRGGTTLAVQIWTVMTGEQPNFELATAISIVILIIVLILNVSVKLVSARLNRKWRT
ncbi:MAG TPA: phosphate ABC transporter permease PstA [Clostridiaceae bacterium]|nr:phosphate ABC transporter permease PstA [Clostridiaceae bacterium]